MNRDGERSAFSSGPAAAPGSPQTLINSQMSGLTKHQSHPLASLTPRDATWLSEELLGVRDLVSTGLRISQRVERIDESLYIIHRVLEE